MESKKKLSIVVIVLLIVSVISIIANITLFGSLLSIRVNTRLCIKLYNGTNIISGSVIQGKYKYFFTQSMEPWQQESEKYKTNSIYIKDCIIEQGNSLIYSNKYFNDTLSDYFFVKKSYGPPVKMKIIIENLPSDKELNVYIRRITDCF